MKKAFILKAVFFGLINISLVTFVYPANDYPHNWINNIGCDSCHFVYGTQPSLMPPWTSHIPQDMDDTQYNTLCWSCHNDIDASYGRTHSSLQTDNSYDNWSVECRTCHNPHYQKQYRTYAGSELYTAVSTSIQINQPVAGESRLVRTNAGWTVDAYNGRIVIPNILKKDYGYKIISNTSDTLTVEGRIDLSKVTPGVNTFAIIYGKLLKETVKLDDIIAHLGVLTDVPNADALKEEGAGWTTNEYQGFKVMPNISETAFTYTILSNTVDTLTVQGPMDLSRVEAGDMFKIMSIKTGNKTVRFFRATGTNSFADGNSTYDGVCEVCHTKTTHFRNNGTGPDQLHLNMGTPAGTNCTDCHKHVNGFQGMGGGAHPTHVLDNNGPEIGCYECHLTGDIPYFKSGTDSNGDGKYELSETDVCTNCHSSNGFTAAKTFWIDDPGTWTTTGGEAEFCGSCHDATPGNTRGDGTGDTATNIIGNNSTYGFYVTGHGKTSGNYERLSWQATNETGNPAANKQCSACHDLSTAHFNNSTARLKAGYQNDANNSNCKQCHNPGAVAVGNPQWYTTYAEYQNAAHKNKKCSDCHDVHGSSGAFAGMTKGNKQNLCNQCHAGHAGHALGVQFDKNNKTYSLECVSCHNVHIVTGLTSVTTPNVSSMTLFTSNTQVWGDDWNEKMDFYAGSGTYRTPQGDSMNGSQMPDYPTFCLDCHATPQYYGSGQFGNGQYQFGPHGSITWAGDQHGLVSSNVPNGGGSSPNWFSFGLAENWDGDDCTGTQAECWPVISKGRGEQLWTRSTYNQEERIAGANFVMSCSDCHVTHESGIGSKIRAIVNGAPGSTNHNTMCNACHYYYSDWHAGMSCGNAGCHDAGNWGPRDCDNCNTIHGMYHASGDGSTRTWNSDLVLDMRFENNLKDSGSYRLNSKWYSASGSFTTGKSGQAALLGENIGVQVGTENSYWSTDEGKHGTWKYTEMKYNTTLQAWVYPTDNDKSEYTIFNKHVGVSNNGGYSFTLKKVNGALRAAFNMAADNNGFSQDGRAGVRGAYSSVAVPLNKWTHIAATFDTNGPDRNPSDPAVGRIRIYVNGEDVTTSDPSGNNMQPVVNETSIYAYSDNSLWNQIGVCYDDSWCASEFAIGGFDWESTNYIGRIDEAKVWNVTKDPTYFASYDSQAGPYISHVEGLIGSNQLTVKFSEGVYTNTGLAGALVAEDFVLTDTGGDNPRTISGVAHTAGASTAVITMSAPLSVADINSDTLAAASNAVYDDYNLAIGTETVIIGLSSQCPTSPITINLNEPSGSSYVMDSQSILYGTVYGGASTLTGSEYSGDGDGSGRYIMFDYNTTCLPASTAMTIETRIKPTGMAGTGNYIRRILARDGNGGYQISGWRNNTTFAPYFNAPSGEASIALWINVVDAHGGNAWKPVLTNYSGAATGSENNCPIVSDHWYLVKAVWNTNKPGGTPGQFFTPADIFIDDQGTDGAGAGENWMGYLNCTDADQSLKPDASKFYTADQIISANSNFAIGTNRATPANNLFNGLIDWITWKDAAD